MKQWFRQAMALPILFAPVVVSAQGKQQASAVAAPSNQQTVTLPASDCAGCIPALTPVELVIDADMGSKISTTGAMFPLHLGKAVIIDGREVIPAGTAGQGEVVHAKKAGGSGSAGEDGLAAGEVLPLRLQPCTTGVVSALTPVHLEILEQLGSNISTTGQTFQFRLAAPINVEECEAIPAGILGTGEVIHAKKSLNSGAAGEFVAAARYFQFGDRKLRLRSLQLVLSGADRIGWNYLRSQIGIFAPLVAKFDPKDPEVVIQPGTIVLAKTAEAFDISLPVAPVPVLGAVAENRVQK